MPVSEETQRILLAVELLLDSFETYRRTGDRLHLAHAARTVEDLRADIHALIRTQRTPA
jgi:hypothetical protein